MHSPACLPGTGAVKAGNVNWVDMDIKVTVKVWFEMTDDATVLQTLFNSMDGVSGWNTPTNKQHAIEIPLLDSETRLPYLKLRKGESLNFYNPPSRQHPEKVGVSNIEAVCLGPLKAQNGNKKIDALNDFLVQGLNDYTKGMFLKNNIPLVYMV